MSRREALTRLVLAGVALGALALALRVPAAAVSGVFALLVAAWPTVWLANEDDDRVLLYPVLLCGLLAGYYLPAGILLAAGMLPGLPG